MFKDVMNETVDGWGVVEASNPIKNVSGVAEPSMDSNGYPIGLGNLPSQGYAPATQVFANNGSNLSDRNLHLDI